MDQQPWYKDGLRFQCTQCGDCCTGEPGYVWVNKAEIESMASRLGMDVDQFVAQFTRKVGVRFTLSERANGDCVLLDAKTRKCTVYEARPRQCKTWPFWRSNVRTPETWQQTCQVCPGAGKGNVIPVDEIARQVAVIKL